MGSWFPAVGMCVVHVLCLFSFLLQVCETWPDMLEKSSTKTTKYLMYPLYVLNPLQPRAESGKDL